MKPDLLTSLEDIRHRDGLSIRSLAKRLNVSNSYLSMVLSGSRGIGVPLLNGIAQAFPELHHAVIAHLVAAKTAVDNENEGAGASPPAHPGR